MRDFGDLERFWGISRGFKGFFRDFKGFKGILGNSRDF